MRNVVGVIVLGAFAVVCWLGGAGSGVVAPGPAPAQVVWQEMANSVDDMSGGGGEEGSSGSPEWKYVPVRRYS